MLSLLAAAAALMQPAAATTPAGDPDLRCMAAYLFAVGQMTDDPKTSAEDKSAGTAMVMYFFGKVRARSPNSDVRGDIKRMVEAPDYVASQLKPDIERCGAEYGKRGEELQAFGDG